MRQSAGGLRGLITPDQLLQGLSVEEDALGPTVLISVRAPSFPATQIITHSQKD